MSGTAAGRPQGGSVHARLQFLSTYQGVAKLIQLILGAFVTILHNWCFCYAWYVGTYGGIFLLNVATPFYIISFWLNLVLFLFHLINLTSVWTSINWRTVGIIFCTTCAVFTFAFMATNFWAAWGIGFFRFHFFLAGIGGIALSLAFAFEAFLLFTGRTEGTIEWKRRPVAATNTVTA